ncbi:hypothetical protein GCM10009863_59850 [Streptomyces axinellae]|uniref:Integrase catalytic domain-containing protein n=1 Tax=Streptomyces axinellae TaxID=552788 RepID=A0ABN3QV48_9ACTN
MDCFSRRLAGWSIADHMRTELVADALKTAAATRGSLSGAIFHADHGARYTSREFATLCSELRVTQSMGAVGTSADNAAAESFNAALKRETLQDVRRYDSARACRLAVFRWVTRYNNHTAALGGRTDAPHRLRTRINYHHTCRITIRTGVHFRGGRPISTHPRKSDPVTRYRADAR